MNKINPTGLKGYEVTDRMKELMGLKPIVENKHTSVVELTKLGPDGKVYGIVRENHEYYIKTAENKKDLVVEDFNYMGGLKNKKEFAYPSYAKATKHLNLKFNSLYESYGIEGKIDILKNDNLLKENYYDTMGEDMGMGQSNLSECCGAPLYEGMCSECGMGMNEYNRDVMNRMSDQYGNDKGKEVYYATANAQDRNPENFEKNEGMMGETEGETPAGTSSNVIDLSTGAIVGTHDYVKGFSPNDRGHQIGYRVSPSIPKGTRFQDGKPQGSAHDTELSELDQAVFDMMEEKAPAKPKKAKLSIEKSLSDMDSIIEEFAPSKKKVYSIK